MLLWKLEPILNSQSWSINSCKLEFIMEAAWYLTETAQTKLHLDTIKQRARQTTLHCVFINFLFPASESLAVVPEFRLTSLQPFCLIFASPWMWYFTASTDVLWRDTWSGELKSTARPLVNEEPKLLCGKADFDRSQEYNESHHLCSWTRKLPFSIAENDSGMALSFYLQGLLGWLMRRNVIKQSKAADPIIPACYWRGQFGTLRNQASYVSGCAVDIFNFLKCCAQAIEWVAKDVWIEIFLSWAKRQNLLGKHKQAEKKHRWEFTTLRIQDGWNVFNTLIAITCGLIKSKILVSSMDVEKLFNKFKYLQSSFKKKKIIKISYYILFQKDGISIVKGLTNSLDNIMSTLDI